MTIRGLSIDTTSIPILGASIDTNRNLLTEESMAPSEVSITGGIYNVSGNFSAGYRPTLINPFIETGLLGKTGGGIADVINYYEITLGDEFNNTNTFASCVLSNCSISVKTKELTKISFDWVGTRKKSTPNPLTSPDYTHEVSIFYNASLGDIKCSSLTLNISRPIGNDDTIIGSEYAQSLFQSDQITVGGNLTIPNKDYALIDKVLTTTDEATWDTIGNKNNTTYYGEIKILFRNPSGTKDLTTITLSDVYAQQSNISMQGRQRIEKTFDFKAKVTNSTGILIYTI